MTYIAESETKSRVDEAVGIARETRSERKPSSHFTETSHDSKDEKTDECVGDQNGGGSGLRQSLASANN